MDHSVLSTVGVDVGGTAKGFHAVALRDRVFEKVCFQSPDDILKWCVERGASIVAVDAPCAFSRSSSSRLCERDLRLEGAKIHCFATPTRRQAEAHTRGFYDWVFNGETLYRSLQTRFTLFDGGLRDGLICLETFPHAIMCFLAGEVIDTKPKASRRRKALRDRGYDDSCLPNIDFVDAALCAITAEHFLAGQTCHFGSCDEGFIVVPKPT